MPSLVDYDTHYRLGRGQCGEPFPPFVAFFDAYDGEPLGVLDLGCGQGRDADTPKHSGQIQAFFDTREATVHKRTRNYLFARR